MQSASASVAPPSTRRMEFEELPFMPPPCSPEPAPGLRDKLAETPRFSSDRRRSAEGKAPARGRAGSPAGLPAGLPAGVRRARLSPLAAPGMIRGHARRDDRAHRPRDQQHAGRLRRFLDLLRAHLPMALGLVSPEK